MIVQEQADIRMGNEIEIIALEQKLSITQVVPGIDVPVKFKGTIDRVDKYKGDIRVLDYKTGRTQDLGIMEWTDLVYDPELSQARQLLLYTMLWNKHNPENPATRASIIGLKDYKKGVHYVGEKVSLRGKVSQILELSQMQKSEAVFNQLVQALFDPNEPFSEPEE